MAGGGRSRSRPRRPAKHRSNEPSSSTTIQSLGEDLLLDIFLRLPSLATLVRAALTCRAWRRAVSSSPAFRRRFRALHPQPLLGLFFEAPSPAQIPINPALPAFVPTRHRDRDLSAAVRGGDFFLTFLEDLPNVGLCWDMVDSCGGCVLLMNWDDGELVVFNPVTRWSGDAFDMSAEGTFEGSRGNYAMIFSDEDPASFRVMRLAHDESRVRVTFFSSDTWEWSVLSWVNVPASSDPHERWIQIEGGMKANGIIYYVYLDRSHIISVDTTTMELSVAELPGCLTYCSFDVGETKDGATCAVYSDHLNVGVFMHTKDNEGVERWVLERVVTLNTELRRVLRGELTESSVLIDLVDEPSELCVLVVQDGYAYLASSLMDHSLGSSTKSRTTKPRLDIQQHPSKPRLDIHCFLKLYLILCLYYLT